MSQYQYPYLEVHQSRMQAPTAWQQEFADAIESVFSKGARELDEVVAGLNGTRVRPPGGADWTSENFTALMRELGA
ncbi:MAG: recombinase-like helix-turn-helix domain-containing protein [Bradyrhizobium sp.]